MNARVILNVPTADLLTRQRFIHAVLRSDLPAFIEKVCRTINPGEAYRPNWHIEAIAAQLDRVRAGEVKRLLINQPPRSLKSIATSVALRRLAARPRPDQAHHCRQLFQ